MSKELDTSWFDLKNYDKLNELDLQGWHSQLSTRAFYFEDKKLAVSLCDNIKKNPIITNYDDYDYRWGDWKKYIKYPFNTLSIASTTVFEFWNFVKLDYDLADVWKRCQLELESDCTDTQQELFSTPLSRFLVDRNIGDLGTHYVTINLSATDEQIMSDFRHWLTEYRKAMGQGYESHKRNFTDKDLSEWIEYRVLPYLDLMMIAKLEGKKMTQAQAARLIFPDEYDVDITERLRRTTKQKAEWLLKYSTIYALGSQINAST